MKYLLLCPKCKESGRRTVVEVTAYGTLSLYGDGHCPLCRTAFSGRVFPDVPEEGIRPGSYGVGNRLEGI
jgi:hypothetical protein